MELIVIGHIDLDVVKRIDTSAGRHLRRREVYQMSQQDYDDEQEYARYCNEQYFLRLIARNDVSEEHKLEYKRKLKEL